MNGHEYALAHGVGFDWRSTGYQTDETGWEYHDFTVTLTTPIEGYKGRNVQHFQWKQGLGVESDPTVGVVLEALVMDAQAGSQSFEDFAADFGYDTDSRKAYATWQACRRTRKQLVALFGEIPSIEDES